MDCDHALAVTLEPDFITSSLCFVAAHLAIASHFWTEIGADSIEVSGRALIVSLWDRSSFEYQYRTCAVTRRGKQPSKSAFSVNTCTKQPDSVPTKNESSSTGKIALSLHSVACIGSLFRECWQLDLDFRLPIKMDRLMNGMDRAECLFNSWRWASDNRCAPLRVAGMQSDS